MNTKTFAQQSRNLLMDGVAKKLLYWGFNTKGEVLETPNKISGGYSFRGEVFDDPSVPQLWEALKKAVQKKGIAVVVEEAAYTWFNRMMAIRIMAKNGYDQSQLDYAEGLEHTPLILQKARQGQYGYLNATEQQRLKKIIGDYSKDQEAFALLLVGYCHSNTMLKTVFGKIDDYTELLLPDNMLQDSGFLHLLNTTDAISDDEYKEVELIGWLYQFYISERKDEVFASFKKKKKAEAKDIPAATQIFTPNWIVKYMVQNTAGKIWLDKHPNSPIKNQMKYLVENSDVIANHEERSGKQFLIEDVTELTLIDPAAGSGHILVEGFDLLYQMYMEEYYAPEEAVESILTKNLFGLDIDDRAAQLATFAILLKAATKYRDVFTKGWLPNVYAMPEAQDFSLQELKDFLGEEGQEYLEELDTAFRLMKQAKNLGSVMKLTLSDEARDYIQERYNTLQQDDYLDLNLKSILQGLKNYIPILLILTNKYACVVANPPYMGSGNMNAQLKNYVSINYPLSKADLFAVFMESCLFLAVLEGYLGMINQHAWMFLPTYKNLREELLSVARIKTMLHLGPRTFEELSGEVVQSTAFSLVKTQSIISSCFYRLVEQKNIWDKEKAFLNGIGLYKLESDKLFHKTPGTPIAYWISEIFSKALKNPQLGEKSDVKSGIMTGNDKEFIRSWYEVSRSNIGFGLESSEDFHGRKENWYPFNKGDGLKKWHPDYHYVLKFKDAGKELKSLKGKQNFRVRDPKYYFNEGMNWSDVGSTIPSFRFQQKGFLFAARAPMIFDNDRVSLGLLNSKVIVEVIKVFNPTLTININDIERVPIIEIVSDSLKTVVESAVQQNIDITEAIDNQSETSWDFEQSPLLSKTNSFEESFKIWHERITHDFFQLHFNEEELNRIFIDLYGLQDELTAEVALNDITILQEELNKKDLEALEESFRANGANAIKLPIDKGEVISQFISYAIGLFMGRYRLDKPGLNIAHPNPTTEELESYTYKNGKVIIDEDAILPLMGKNCNFPDDALQQFQQLLDTIWGHDTRTENINFIQECLDKTIEKFLVNNFYKYHCSMYKKKPIYWLFASPKGAFQVLVYMHRMNAFTVEKIRANYLLEHIKNLRSEESILVSNESNLSTQEAKRLDQIRKDITECETYDLELKDVADQQIAFDLDDGVTVNYKKFESVMAKIK